MTGVQTCALPIYGELGRELARIRAERLGELHGRVARPVAVLARPRAVERDRIQIRLDRDAAALRGVGDGGEHDGSEVLGIHDIRAYRARPALPAGLGRTMDA